MLAYLHYTLRDSVGNEVIFSLHLHRSAWEVAQVQAYSDGFAPVLDAATGGQIVAARTSYVLLLPAGIKSSPYPDADVARGGLLTFDMDSGYKESLRFPTIDNALVNADFTLDTAAQALADLISAYTGGITVGAETATLLSDREEAYTAQLAARLSFRHQPGLAPVGTSPEAPELVQVEINPAWLPVLLGTTEALQEARWWAGDVAGLDTNQRHVDELLHALAAAAPEPVNVFRLDVSQLDSVAVLN